MNPRELSNLIGKTFSCADAIRHFKEDNLHILEGFFMPEKINVTLLTNVVIKHYESKGYVIPKSVSISPGMLMFQNNENNKELITVTITAIKTHPTSIVVTYPKKEKSNIRVGL